MQMINLKDIKKIKKPGLIKKIKKKLSDFRTILKTHKEIYQFMGIITTQFSAYRVDKNNTNLPSSYMKTAKEYIFLICENATEVFVNSFQDNYEILTLDLKKLEEKTPFMRTWKRHLKENNKIYDKLRNKMKKSTQGDYFS